MFYACSTLLEIKGFLKDTQISELSCTSMCFRKLIFTGLFPSWPLNATTSTRGSSDVNISASQPPKEQAGGDRRPREGNFSQKIQTKQPRLVERPWPRKRTSSSPSSSDVVRSATSEADVRHRDQRPFCSRYQSLRSLPKSDCFNFAKVRQLRRFLPKNW